MSGAVGSNPLLTRAYIASEAMTDKHFVKVNATEGYIDICDTLGDPVLGVIDHGDDATAADVTNLKRLTVTLAGIAVVVAGGAINFGDRVRTDANGAAVVMDAAVGNQNQAGIAMQDAASGDWVPILLTPGAAYNTAVS